MICNLCGEPMVQYKGIGGGSMSPQLYTTWELKYCPGCEDYVIEEYEAKRVSKQLADSLDVYHGKSRKDKPRSKQKTKKSLHKPGKA